MMKQYFFMFSHGEDAAYYVGGLYICDHEVAKEEWEAFVEAMSELHKGVKLHWLDVFAGRNQIQPRHRGTGYFGGYEGWWRSDECNAYQAYLDENNAQKLFIAKHNMQRVEHTELWSIDD